MKYIRDDELKMAFVTMVNKLVFGHRIILKPYVEAIKGVSKDTSLRRIQEIQSLLLENAEQRETLTKLMAQDYIDQHEDELSADGQEDTQGEDGESSQDSGTDEENTEEGTEG